MELPRSDPMSLFETFYRTAVELKYPRNPLQRCDDTMSIRNFWHLTSALYFVVILRTSYEGEKLRMESERSNVDHSGDNIQKTSIVRREGGLR